MTACTRREHLLEAIDSTNCRHCREALVRDGSGETVAERVARGGGVMLEGCTVSRGLDGISVTTVPSSVMANMRIEGNRFFNDPHAFAPVSEGIEMYGREEEVPAGVQLEQLRQRLQASINAPPPFPVWRFWLAVVIIIAGTIGLVFGPPWLR